MRSGFAHLHPFVNFVFFAFVLLFAMFLSHPAVQIVGLLCAGWFALHCSGRKKFVHQLWMILPVMLFAAVINPLVSHQGVTVLFYFSSGNACTLESLLYGVSAAVRLGTTLLWFIGWNAVMTSDKFVYLFGRLIPSLALTVSMGLRFVPRLIRRMREVAAAQRCLLPDERGWLAKVRRAGRVVSIVITWALENALDTADSMKSRGYGLPKRTAFSLYRFTMQDAACLLILLVFGGMVLAGQFTGGLYWQYYPFFEGMHNGLTVLWLAAFALLSIFPLMFDAKEALLWRVSKSRI